MWVHPSSSGGQLERSTVGRAWNESLRIDTANHILGLRLNDWTSLVVFTGAVAYFVISTRRHPGRETLTG